MAQSHNAKSLAKDYLLKDLPSDENPAKDAAKAIPDVSATSDEAPPDANADQENADDETPEIKLETAPGDYRFPTTNQSRHCFTRYVEYHRCVAAKGEGAPECDKFAKYYRSLCPGEWIREEALIRIQIEEMASFMEDNMAQMDSTSV